MFKLANVHRIQCEFAILKMPAFSCAATGDLKEERRSCWLNFAIKSCWDLIRTAFILKNSLIL